jgi:hypothetical protein
LEALVYLVSSLIGWPLQRFRRWLDRQPDRDPSQLSGLQRLGRAALGLVVCLLILAPLVWLILK